MSASEKIVDIKSLKLYDTLLRSEIDKQIENIGEGLAEVAKSGSYNDLIDTPEIPVRATSIAAEDVGYASGNQVYNYVLNAVSGIQGAMHFKGVTDGTDWPPANPVSGDVYITTAPFTAGSENVEPGDLLTYVVNEGWKVVQANIDGAVTGPSTATDDHIVLFSGATGKVIKDSGITLLDMLNEVTITQINAGSTTLTPVNKVVTLADVAASGSYTDLTDTPDLLVHVSTSTSPLAETTFAPVAISGSYNDLTDKPTINSVSNAEVDSLFPNTTLSNG